MARPRTTRIAVQLMILGAIVSVVQGVLVFANTDQLRRVAAEQFETQGLEPTPELVNSSVNAAMTVTLLTGLGYAVLWLWMAWANNKGHRWARIVATVFYVISVLIFIYALFTPAPVSARVLATLSLAIGTAAIVLLYRQDSSDWIIEQTASPNRM
ncbi:hypothetical protein ACQBAU_00225 [Propionibacteriaceae bacterium Y2011]